MATASIAISEEDLQTLSRASERLGLTPERLLHDAIRKVSREATGPFFLDVEPIPLDRNGCLPPLKEGGPPVRPGEIDMSLGHPVVRTERPGSMVITSEMIDEILFP